MLFKTFSFRPKNSDFFFVILLNSHLRYCCTKVTASHKSNYDANVSKITLAPNVRVKKCSCMENT